MFITPESTNCNIKPINISIFAQPFVVVQVLQMSVPIDDNDSYNDLQLDFSRKNHAFTLDNVSYITKDNGDSIGKIIC